MLRTRTYVFACAIALLVAPAVRAGDTTGSSVALTTERIAVGLSDPLYVTAPPGDVERLFIVEQNTALIKIRKNNAILGTPFIDLNSKASSGGERGLLGLAFHPNYRDNGFFFVNYTSNTGATVVERYTVSANPDVADPASAKLVLTVGQPFSNHNGGCLQFGPNDGYLYIGMGDGGAANDPGNRSQNGNVLLGKMLRIDVDSAGAYDIPPDNPFVGVAGIRDEIWAFGVRNPWRFSFDRDNGDMYIGDVGQDAREEVSWQPGTSPGGENYGWRCMEGTACTGLSGCTCNAPALTLPIHEYPHPPGVAVTGGYVYRGCAIPELEGTYFFADFVGDIWSFDWDGSTKTNFTDRNELEPGISLIPSFGEDGLGEMYIVDSADGEIYKIVREQADVTLSFLPVTHEVSPGEVFEYQVRVRNHTAEAQPIEAWIDVFLPNGELWGGSPILGPVTKTIAPNAFITKTLRLRIPNRVDPSGPYVLRIAHGTFDTTFESTDCLGFYVVP